MRSRHRLLEEAGSKIAMLCSPYSELIAEKAEYKEDKKTDVSYVTKEIDNIKHAVRVAKTKNESKKCTLQLEWSRWKWRMRTNKTEEDDF